MPEITHSTRSEAPTVDPADTGSFHKAASSPTPGPEPETQTLAPAAGPTERGSAYPSVPGYEILGELGRGGMGVVYRARQVGLNRVVALKMILAGAHAGPQALARFKAEAEAVAQLQHPNIVQIYEIGEWRLDPASPPLPYFSLEFVEGGSLAERLAGTPMQPRDGAHLVETLAHAMQTAHEKGIVHRDLKPANVLIGDRLSATGNRSERKDERGPVGPKAEGLLPTAVKITDFGLAKQLRDAEGGEQLTATGTVLGTPSYMAPEQADGRTEAIGPRTDVYALGAILYELLTGRPPFKAATPLDTVLQVVCEEPVAPSQLVARTPRDLETICLKCLQKEPVRRYGTAAALAEDLGRFLRGEPISARPVGRLERTWRWCRRKPVVAGLTAAVIALLIATVSTSTGLSVWALGEKERADDNATLEREARELADANFERAEKAVETYLDGIEKHDRLKEADFFEFRKKLLSTALPYYEAFLQQKPGNVRLESKRGRASFRLAWVRAELGEAEQAIAEYERAAQIYGPLVEAEPDEPGHQQNLATAHNNRGNLLNTQGKRADAEQALRQGLALRKKLAAEHPENPLYRSSVGQSHNNIALLLSGAGQSSAAVSEYEQAIAIHEELAKAFPSVPSYQQDLGRSLNNLATMVHRLGKLSEAEPHYLRTIAIRAKLAKEWPAVPEYLHDLAMTQNNLAVLFNDQGKHGESEAAHRQALQSRQRLAADFPTIPSYRADLARGHNNLAMLFHDLEKWPEAEAGYREAIAIREKLAADYSRVPHYRQDLANARNNLAELLRDRQQWAAADPEYRAAIGILEKLVAESPTNPGYREDLAAFTNNLGLALANAGRKQEAEATHRQAIALQQKLVADFPEMPKYRTHLAAGHNNLANLLRGQSKWPEAEVEYRNAITIQEKLVKDVPKAPSYAIDLGRMEFSFANLLRDRGSLDAALETYARAAETLRRARQLVPRNLLARRALVAVGWEKGKLLTRLGRHAEALKEWDAALEQDDQQQVGIAFARALTLVRLKDHARATSEATALLERRGNPPGLLHYEAARIFAAASRAVEHDPALQAQYLERSLDLLRQAVRFGYKHGEHIRNDEELAPLRSRAEYRKLLDELSKRTSSERLRDALERQCAWPLFWGWPRF